MKGKTRFWNFRFGLAGMKNSDSEKNKNLAIKLNRQRKWHPTDRPSNRQPDLHRPEAGFGTASDSFAMKAERRYSYP